MDEESRFRGRGPARRQLCADHGKIGGFNELAYTQLSTTGSLDVFDLVAFTINVVRLLNQQSAANEEIDLPVDDEFALKIMKACARIRI